MINIDNMNFTTYSNLEDISYPYQELPFYENEYTNSKYILCCPQCTPEYRCFLFRCYTMIFIFMGGMICLIYYITK